MAFSSQLLTSSVVIGVAALLGMSAAAGEVTLEDNSLQVAFDSDSGALTRLENKTTHWVIERRPELGMSFRLFAPLPNRRYNPVLGQKQHVAEIKKVSDHEIDFLWKNLASENGGVLPMTLAAAVTLTNGVLIFDASLVNDSSLTVETIDYPYFGDFNPPARDSSLAAMTMTNNQSGNLQTDEVYPHFRNEKGYWGVTYPTKTLEAQPSLFCLMQAPGQGLYCELNNHTAPYRLQYTFEQHPGVVSGATSLVPPSDEFSGFPVHLEFRFCHFIFAHAHSTTSLSPIAMRCYQGGWQTGADLSFKRENSMIKILWLQVSAALLAATVLTAPSALAEDVTLEDQSMAATFDADSGALTHLENKSTHWVIERRPELGISFQLNAPTPDQKDNFVLGRKQHAVEVKKISDQQVRLRWQDLQSEHGGVLPITLTAIVSLTNGVLRFDTTLENDSSLMVSTVDYPCLGDLNPPATGMPLWSKHQWYGSLQTQDISRGATIMSKQSLFCLIQSTNQGLYVEMHDPTEPYLITLGFAAPHDPSSTTHPSHVEFQARHFVYAHPHTTAKLIPLVLRGYEGDWHAGADCYKEWRATWYKEPYLPDWAKEVHSWTMLRMNTPEQDYSVPYTNLVKYGRDWAANGVRAVQVVGWNNGGQDGGDPTQDTDPGLGTWQQFHDAIAQVQGMGVKVILFAKLNWADLTTAWYTNELYKYECTDQNGKREEQGGYAYVTPTQLAGIGLHRRAVMDFLDPAYRQVALNEFNKILALGSEGWLWDEVCHHASVLYSWAPNHGYTPPGYVYAGDLPLSAELRAAADKVSPDFIFSGEGPQDWLMQYFPFSETGVTAVPICQYLDRHALMLAGVSGFDDREQLNMILLRRCIIQYEPFLYKGYVSDFPLTMAYGKKIDALRGKYKAWLWDGEFRDTLGAQVSADGPQRYSVFVADNGKRAVVVINPESNRSITAKVALPNAGKLDVATPEQPDAVPSTGTLVIPARSAAVLMEQ